MKVTKVTIDNFRNIEHAEYDLERVNLFKGPNQMGKTNTILAIYWVLTDYLFDGSSDYASFKPQSDTKKKVEVELTFEDGFKLKKSFKEKWTKTRGSSEETMTGHVTEFHLNGIKTKQSDAKEEILEKFGLDGKSTKGFDLLRGLIDPYYFAKGCEWKELREFIIDLCGDVSNEDVFKEDQDLLVIKDRLEVDKYNTAKTVKYYKQEIKQIKETIKSNEGKVEGLSLTKDVSDTDLQSAKLQIANIDKQIEATKSGDPIANATNILLDQLSKAQDALERSKFNDQKLAQDKNTLLNQYINDKLVEENKLIAESNEARRSMDELGNEIVANNSDINRSKLEMADKDNKCQRMRDEYARLVKWQPHATTCPNCQFVLNQESVDQEKAQHDKELENCIQLGKRLSVEVSNLGMKIAELEETNIGLNKVYEELKNSYESFNAPLKAIRNEVSQLKSQVVPVVKSQETIDAEVKIADLKNQIDLERNKTQNEISSANIAVMTLEDSKAPYQAVINQHIVFKENQKTIKRIQGEIKANQKALIQAEQAQILVNDFIQTKLKLFNSHISSVFNGVLKFNLIQENIKAGSWDEVCVPMIINKDTPFMNGSGSEQILTGIYFAECVKKQLGLEDLPYIFDECDKLDTAHLSAIDTQAQLISTIVDDVNYKEVSLVASK